jgi:predicted metal-dependent hydrolase
MKTMRLSVVNHKMVRLSFPWSISFSQAEKFLMQKLPWIQEVLKEIDRKAVSHEGRSYQEVKSVTTQKVLEALEYYAPRMGVEYKILKIKKFTSQWGSCSTSGVITLEYRLSILPRECMEYVVVHELAHRLEMNHSKKFWDIVETQIPDYKQRKKRLSEYTLV